MTLQCGSMMRSVVPAGRTAALGVWKRESGRAERMNYLVSLAAGNLQVGRLEG